MVESKSLKLYLFSFRNQGEFHEDVINRITKDLFQVLHPLYLRVYGNFNIRGGIAIKPLVEIFGTTPDQSLETQNCIDKLVEQWDRIK